MDNESKCRNGKLNGGVKSLEGEEYTKVEDWKDYNGLYNKIWEAVLKNLKYLEVSEKILKVQEEEEAVAFKMQEIG